VHSRAGFTLAETVVALGLIAMLVGGVAFSTRQVLRSSKLSQVTAKLVDGVILARTRAVATQSSWRVNFAPPDPPGSEVSQKFFLQCVAHCTGDPSPPQKEYTVPHGFGLKVPPDGEGFTGLTFSQNGRFQGAKVDIVVCMTVKQYGKMKCDLGAASRTVTIHANTGRLEY
jgi:type II secretory pathway pseudopilin PulG